MMEHVKKQSKTVTQGAPFGFSDEIAARPRIGDNSQALVTRYLAENPRFSGGEWFNVDRDAMTVKVNRLPQGDEINSPANEKLIVEYYSK